MTLESGARLGPYEILSVLGAGGMGKVYRARDTRLDRFVAVKVVSDHLSSSSDSKHRFEREAKAISALSHPHICALYDVGHEGDVDYLVMELIEGETLAERLARGPLPLEHTLQCGVETASALDRAHRQGIIHRDLKPGNVMLTKSGVKLLDFGLAKLVPASGPVSNLSMLPTTPRGSKLTAEGTILGTFQYMAPEQLEGKEADTRTDIFALGALLYEMATGRKAFSGKSQASLISAIMSSEPPSISSVEPTTPPAVDRIVRTCLAKDPEDRWQNAHDLESELKWIASSGSASLPRAADRNALRERIAWFVAVATVVVLLAVVLLHRPSDRLRPTHFEVSGGASRSNFTFSAFGLAPDGRGLEYVEDGPGGQTALWIRDFGEASPRPLSGTEDADMPFWSPDGSAIGFFSEGKLKRISASGGPVQVVCDAEKGRGGSWGPDGTILLARTPFSGIDRVPAAGGKPVAVTSLNAARGEASHRFPWFLPDGRHFLYFEIGSAGAKDDVGGIFVSSLDGKERRRLRSEASNAVYAEPGYLMFYRDRTVFAQPFDAKSLRLSGEPVPVAARVEFRSGYGYFSPSKGGTLAYRIPPVPSLSRLRWRDRAGRETGVLGEPGHYQDFRLSPDGRRAVLSRLEPDLDRSALWVIDVSRESMTRLTDGASYDHSANWLPDGRRILFTSRPVPGGVGHMFSVSDIGSEKKSLGPAESGEVVNDVSPDGRHLLYAGFDPKTDWDLWVMDLGDAGQRVPFVRTKDLEIRGQFSPDGRWIAYLSSESGRTELYVASFPDAANRIQVSRGGASPPIWSRDGKEIFYLTGGRKLMVVPFRGGPTAEVGAPTMLFELRFELGYGWNFGVSGDSQRFLINEPDGEKSPSPIHVVLNWPAVIKN